MASRAKAGDTTTLVSENWVGVRTTEEPWDDSSVLLQDMTNMVIPDAEAGSRAEARRGFSLINTQMGSGSLREGQAVFTFTDATGYLWNIGFCGGKMYRYGTAMTTPVDVTPANILISATGHIYAGVLDGVCVVNDGLSQPWYFSDATTTPIVGTRLDYTLATVNLSRGSTATKVANAAFAYQLESGGVVTMYTMVANAVGSTIGAGTIPINQWGVWRVSIAVAGTLVFTAGAANFTTGYASNALAIAALPALPAASWNVGYFTVQTGVGVTWISGTDALQGGVGGNPANATNYYAGASEAWTATGRPTVYNGSIVMILRSVGEVMYGTSVVWSEPNDPTVGYEQDDGVTAYDNQALLTQTGSAPVYCLQTSESQLFYFRKRSIGALLGPPSDFRTSPNADVSFNLGCINNSLVASFGQYIYFTNWDGRVYRFALGGAPEPLWLQMRGALAAIDSVQIARAWAAIEPVNNWYVAYIPGTASGQMYCFDAQTGRYMGRWFVLLADLATKATFGIGAAVTNATTQATDGTLQLVMIGQNQVPAEGYTWKYANVGAVSYADNSTLPSFTLTTNRLGYSVKQMMNATELRTLVEKKATLAQQTTGASIVTPTGSTTLTASTGTTSNDTIGRIVWTLTSGVMGRGFQVTLTGQPTSPTATTAQFVCYGIELDVLVNGPAPVGEQ